VARAVLGIDRIDSGEIVYKGEPFAPRSFKEAVGKGFGLIPEDRKLQGLVLITTVRENICMVNMSAVIRAGVLRGDLEKKYGEEYVKKLNIATPSLDTEAQYLSGGNQQKIVVGKWLLQNSDVIFLDEPTRGIDVGAKAEIYLLINDLVRNGKVVIMISSELGEILGMSDRIMVMHEGRIAGELKASEATQESIISMCV
jgi:ABC-type sugar transport system ATPase subunit